MFSSHVAPRHDRTLIARWTLRLWCYVCVTGVIVEWMVYQPYAAVHA